MQGSYTGNIDSVSDDDMSIKGNSCVWLYAINDVRNWHTNSNLPSDVLYAYLITFLASPGLTIQELYQPFVDKVYIRYYVNNQWNDWYYYTLTKV